MIERPSPRHEPYRPSPRDVSHLIERARKHPLGLEFLDRGALDAVAATFQVHAFTVEEARNSRRQPAD